MVYLGQKLFGVTLTVILLLAIVDGKPSYYDTNEIERIQPGLTYNSYYQYPGFNRYPDNQYEKLRLFFEGQDLKPETSGGAENYFHEPEKRQAVRYRQCYFNPISCFRK